MQIQEAEIAACEWVDPEIYLSQSFFKKSGQILRIIVLIVLIFRCLQQD